MLATRCTKGEDKPDVEQCTPGVGLSWERTGKVSSNKPAFQPYRGKLAVRLIGGIVETSASFEARTAPRSYPTEADDERTGEVEHRHSSCEAGEQSGAIRRGVSGAKDGDQGKCGSAKHAPGSVPGKCVTGAGTGSDFPPPYIIGYGSSPSRCGPGQSIASGQTRDLPASGVFLLHVMCSSTPAGRQHLA